MGKGKALNLCLTILLSLAAANAPAFAAKTIYVDDDATGANNGSSWTDAYRFLQDALSDANSSAKPVEIRVAQGKYRPDEDSVHLGGTGNREAAFQLISGVTLRGGYAGFGEPDPNARDIDLYEAILTGDIGGISTADNSYHVVIGSRTDETAVLDGFVITRGNADGVDYPHHCGGGMYNDAGSPTVVNCTFLLNSAFHDYRSGKGGGMYNIAGGPTLIGCIFEGNDADGYKGVGMYNEDSTLNLNACTFQEHWAGGAMASFGSILKLVDCMFIRNSDMGGCGMSNSNCTVALTACSFIDNGPGEAGGGGGMCNSHSDVLVTDCIFSGNGQLNAFGAGMYNSDCNVTVSDCTFEDNWTWAIGGGMFNTNSSIEVTNCAFRENTARGEGGGIANDGDDPGSISNCIFAGNIGYYGGGMANGNDGVEVINCVFVGNLGTIGVGGLCSYGPVINCIVWGNTPIAFQIDAFSVEFSSVQGGYAGEGNIDADPCFVDIGHWGDNDTPEETWDDFYVSGDYHLKSQGGRWDASEGRWVIDEVTSPCIDAGDPMSPIGLEPFPNGGIINMGAYGGTAEASKSYFNKPPCDTIVAGDINGDCQINFKDFFFIALHWLTANTQ